MIFGNPRRFPNVSVAALSLTACPVQVLIGQSDKDIVSRFVENAVNLLDAAESALRAGFAPSDMSILISPEGGIRMVADSDWSLEALQAHHGARMAYRVSQQDQKVRIEGKAGSRTCTFETNAPDQFRRLLGNGVPPTYSVSRCPVLRSNSAESSGQIALM